LTFNESLQPTSIQASLKVSDIWRQLKTTVVYGI